MEDLEYDDDGLGSLTRCFLEYSAAHWPDHVRNMALTSIQKESDQVHLLYDITGKPFSMWFSIFWNGVRPYERTPIISALHLAAFNGYEQEQGANVNAQGGTYGNAL
ncbi:unnamed protein product [Penicillium camemberti]|uniref:Str. FM013 n=1 Tax=Penicillium camemberti (strain FM 013) TaxID=1429867 RepID=A0A0G4PDS3_PENC3|nr:unnamed protein product [Penicillium camemberti]